MFTGIISEIGKVKIASKSSSLFKLSLQSKALYKDSVISDSIAVNGVCLTLTAKKKDLLFFEAMTSTLASTNIKRLKPGDFINLEPALKTGDKLGGHFVLGHIDCELKLRRKIKKSGFWELEIELPARFRKYILENGSVALEGVSLTVKKIMAKVFTVEVLPFTHNNTTIQHMRSGDWINVEFDYLLKKPL